MQTKLLRGILLLSSIVLAIQLSAAPCSPPAIGSWIINGNCQLTESAVLRGNLIIQNDATLTIESGVQLIIDLDANRIEVRDGSHLIIRSTGGIRNLMIEDTDGRFGFYLKEVNGPVILALNEEESFYPASSIKVLQHVYALREVQAGNANLATSLLTVCPGNNNNCTNNPNTNANCGANTISENLSTALSRMMMNSDNESTNAVQEFFGSGNPAAGRNLMNQMGYNILGLSNNTALQHKLSCGNITNDPFNTSTLEDLAEIYEEVVEDNNVLAGSATSNFFNLMLNENNDNNLLNEINAVVDEENAHLQLSASDLTAFKAGISTARKPGGVTCCVSNAGWVELPHGDGTSDEEYVFSLFIDDFTVNTVNMLEVAAEMLRKPIRNAMSTWVSQ